MGPIRRGLILALIPLPAWAGVCEEVRPGWDGTPITILGETLALLSAPAALLLVVLSLAAIRFRAQWLGLGTIVFWTIFVSVITMATPSDLRDLARAEGCVGSPALFIALAAAICGAIVIYTKPRTDNAD